MSPDNFVQAIGLAVGLLAGIVGHEYAHARVSDSLGDRTPRLQGRLTLNPKAHADVLGTIVLPGLFVLSVLVGKPNAFPFMFGWAKPVPTNPRQLRRPRDHTLIVAVAGPLTNLALAGAAGWAFQAAARGGSSTAAKALFWVAVANVFLFVINALPIPPLDGSKILARFLSPSAAYRLEEMGRYGLLFLIVLYLFSPLTAILTGLTDPLIELFTGL